MNLIRLNNIKKTFGGTLLFDHVSFEINDSDKVAIIGKNGVGKSTLFKMILNEIAPDSGDIFIFGQARIGYLSQDVLSNQDLSLYEEMLLVFQQVEALGEKLHQAMEAMAHSSDPDLIERYSRLEEEYRMQGGYDYPVQIDTILTRFGFSKAEYLRKVESFSGGEKTRIAFAKLLLIKPDILLLDEPTNHMDIEIIEWLEEYLKRYVGAVIVITHDKYFINKVVNRIFEIDQETLEKYTGTYEMYEIEKEKRYELLLKKYVRQQKTIEHLQSFVDRFRYKATKAKSAQDRIKKLERIERIQKPTQQKKHVNAEFTSKRSTDAVILEINDMTIGYDCPLSEHIDLKMRGVDKIGIIGPNGIGKTTFIKTILGEVEPLQGEFHFLKQLKVGYFDQTIADLPKSGSLIELIHGIYPQKTLNEVRTLLARFMFYAEDVFKDVSILSGGEKVRLRLLLLMLEKPEIMILDEPTNHLDIETKTIVEDVFEDYGGPVIFISHDRYFINKVASRILAFTATGWQLFEGNYDEYKQMMDEKVSSNPKKPKREKPIRVEKEIERLETDINRLTEQIEAMKASLFLPEIYSDKAIYQRTSAEIEALEKNLESILLEAEKWSDERS